MEDNRAASDLLLLLGGGEGAGATGNTATDFPALLPAEAASAPGLGHDLHHEDASSKLQIDPLGSALATPPGALYQQERGNGGNGSMGLYGGPGATSEPDFLRTPPHEDGEGQADSTGDPVVPQQAAAAANGAGAAEGTAAHAAEALGAHVPDAVPRQHAAPTDQQMQQEMEKGAAAHMKPNDPLWQQGMPDTDQQLPSDQGSDQAAAPQLLQDRLQPFGSFQPEQWQELEQREQQPEASGSQREHEQEQQRQLEQELQQQEQQQKQEDNVEMRQAGAPEAAARQDQQPLDEPLDEGDVQEMQAHHDPHARTPSTTPAALDTGPAAVGGSTGGGVILSTHDREWLLAITTALGFFKPCGRQHPGGLRGTDGIATYFDVDDPSSGPMCGLCAANPARARHRVVQVRRSTYHEVLKLGDITALMDVTGIQPYVINAAKVLFLRPRPQPRAAKGGAAMPAVCIADGRQLMDSTSRYCSIRCKLETEDAPFAAALAAVKPHEPYVPRPTSRAATHHRPAKPPKDGTPRPGGRAAPSGGGRPASRTTSEVASPTASEGAAYDGSRRTGSPATVSSAGTTGTAGTGGRKRGRQEQRRRRPSPALAAVGRLGAMAPVLEEGDEEGVHFNAGGLKEVELPHWGTQVRRNRAGQLSMASGGVVHRTSDDGGGAQPLLDAGELSDSCSQKRRRGEREATVSGADSAAQLARAERRMRARRAAATAATAAGYSLASDEEEGKDGKGTGASIMTSSRTTGGDSAFDSTGSHRRKALTPQRSPLQ